MLMYAGTIFIGAFLLFQIQPMIAKMILPWFGGSAAVWITCMLFFQTWLLAGYIYAHILVRYLKPRLQMLTHAVLLCTSLLILPIVPASGWKPTGSEAPILRILGLLTVSVGLPYFLLSTTSPLLQAWYSRKYKTALPYRLFALSNLASLLGLLVYPFLVEPTITIRQQSTGWSSAYAVFVIIAIATAWISRHVRADDICSVSEQSATDHPECQSPSFTEKLLWLALAACASTMLLAVTNHLTQNVTSIPFLWILPLSLYLLSFILCFDYENLYSRNAYLWIIAMALGVMAYGLVNWNARMSLMLVIISFSAGLFACCMFCHGELVKRKPHSRFLTSFYLMLSAGGALGGLIVGLAAPTLFSGYYELPASLAACAILLFIVHIRRRWYNVAGTLLVVGVILACGYYVYTYQQTARAMVRNFYGMLRVNEYDKGEEIETRRLVHGSITHGVQFIDPEWRRDPIAYYAPESGVGMAIKHLRKPSLQVGVVGLGAGTLAAYAEPGDLFRFYEINPLVEKLAREEFTYLSDCRGTAEIILGDARLSLEQEKDRIYDLLVVDAFSGDSIPAHLLTTQALELYFRHLGPDGVLALHISNAHLNLEPVVEKLGSALGKQAVMISSTEDETEEIYSSDWVLMTSAPLKSPEIAKAAGTLKSDPAMRVWTDDYSNLFQILKKKRFWQ
ncbi:MAG: fused MFS/spermidine synthase [Nitrospirae bacterium]|nr:fused MFS/spermidine synthase [Nitrospirota bacterium]